MTKAEDLVRSTTRAIASSVHDVPALRLDPAPNEPRSAGHRPPRPRSPQAGGWPGRWRSWLGPATAVVVVVVAVAIALVIVKDIRNGSGPAPLATNSAAAPEGVPPYYVALMPADTPNLVVGNTVTGARVAIIMAPSGVRLRSVYGGAADDRTFIVAGDRPGDASAGTQWYQLRITPGTATPARLTPLLISVRQVPVGVAISPDATKLAVALPGIPGVLRVYSMATGTLLRSWSVPDEQLMAVKSPAGYWQSSAMVLRWSADGRALGFAWNEASIRVLDASAPNGNLLAWSTARAVVTPAYNLVPVSPDGLRPEASPCIAAGGWDLVDGGRTVACTDFEASVFFGGTGGHPVPVINVGRCASPSAAFAFILKPSSGPQAGETVELAQGFVCPSRIQAGDGAYLGWASADGSILIGALVANGHSRFGIYHGGHFTPLPPPPVSMLAGTDAW